MHLTHTAIYILITLVSANLDGYQKFVIPPNSDARTVQQVVGKPDKIEKRYGSGDIFEGVLIGEKWFYSHSFRHDRNGFKVSWIEMDKNHFQYGTNDPVFFSRTDMTFKEEVLKVKKGLLERMSNSDIQIRDVSLQIKYSEGPYKQYPMFQLKFSHVNKRNLSIDEVTFYIELVDDEDSPVSSHARKIVSRNCKPDMKNEVDSSLSIILTDEILNVPRFLRFSAYDSAGKKLPLSDGLYEIVEPK